jgi:outer membrane protein OmpA-like peptidoglycan-associated protein
MESVMDMARMALGTDTTLSRLSSWLGESPAVTKAAVQDAIPVSLVGLANQASTDEGSREMLGHLQRGDYPQVEPEEFGRTVNDPAATDRLVKSSQGFMGGLFGGKLGNIVDGIAKHTGARRSGISSLLGLAAPLVMGIIGKQTRAENLDAGGLRRYLGEQKNIAAGALPGPLANLVMPGGPTARVESLGRAEPVARRRGFAWWILPLLALLALLAWGLSRMGRRESAGPARVTAPVTERVGTLAAGDVTPLSRWLDGTSPAPQRFLLGVTFGTDSAEMVGASRELLDEVANTLNAHPGARIRVEGHTDATGEAEANRRLSQDRADATKRYLVDRGVDAGRIETDGLGADRPVASNDDPAGRARNRRTELVVVSR